MRGTDDGPNNARDCAVHNSEDRYVWEEGKKRKWLWTLDVARSEDYYRRVLWFGGEWSSHTSVVAHRRYSLGRELQLFNFSFGTQPAVGCFEPCDCISSC